MVMMRTVITLTLSALSALCGPAGASATSEHARLAAIEELKNTIHTLPAEEAARRWRALERRETPPPRQDAIDHFVVLYMENQAMLRTLGCMQDELPGLDGISEKDGMFLPKDPKNKSAGVVNISCGTGIYVCESGPGFSFLEGKSAGAFFERGADGSTYPYPPQSVANAAANGATGKAVEMFHTKSQLPIKHALASTYGVFNKMYTASPTMSWPNHMFTQTGTSCGCTSTGPTYDQGGGPTKTYPQFSIYDTMALDGVSFGLYANATCGFGDHPPCTELASAFDTYMAGVARHPEHFNSQTTFYEQAANGSLPAFSFFSPSWQACDHPCNDIAKGERLLKDVYEALRAGPKWNQTMFLVTYDDIGGYFDHIIPPFENVPAPDAPCNSLNDGFPSKFDFRRLGGRTTSIMMGGKVPKAVFQEPKRGPQNTSQFDLASVAATVHKLFNLSTALTLRTMWSGTFDELLLTEARPDNEMPLHLPDAPKASEPWVPPPGANFDDPDVMDPSHDDDDDDGDDDRRRRLAEAMSTHVRAQHCGSSEQSCRGVDLLSVKHERRMRHFSELTGEALPAEMATMTPDEADNWIRKQAKRWSELGHPIV